MEVSKRGLAEIASHEGIVQMPYKDSVGVWTIGIGHTAGAGKPYPANMPKGVPISMEKVFALFAKDIKKFETRVNKRIGAAKVTQHAFDGAVSFDYNTGGIHRASWVAYWLSGNMAEAARRIMFWNKPKEITARRRKERDLIRHGTYGDGWATVYPAYASGRVNWGKGRRVNLLDILTDQGPEAPQQEPKNLAYYQNLLIALGYHLGAWGADGVYGPVTRAAVQQFQRDEGTLVVDGILGPITSQALEQAMSDNPKRVAKVAAVGGGAAAASVAVAGFPWQTSLAMAIVTGLVYVVWHFRYDIRERVLSWTG